jgi:hypothetical protein
VGVFLLKQQQMKPFILFAFILSLSAGNTQTPLISHKSHAGSSTSYLIASNSNFGAIKIDLHQPPESIKPYRSEKFKPLNDSVIILEIMDIDQNIIQIDTLPNEEKFSPIIFEFRYKDSIRKKEVEENYKREMEQEEQLKKQQLESQQQIKQETTPAKKKKKSYLLFLFGITGGGMLMMKLFTRSKTVKPSIA